MRIFIGIYTGFFRAGFWLAAFMLALPLTLCAQSSRHGHSYGLNPHKRLSQFILDHWDINSGLPSNDLLDIYQSADGFLWLCSYNGLTRYDGWDFVVYGKKHSPVFENNSATAITEGHDGTLWIGTQGSGLLSMKNGAFAKHGGSGFFAQSLAILDSNTVWVGTRLQGLKVLDIEKGTFSPLSYPLLDGFTINDIRISGKTVWLATEGNGVLEYENGRFRQYAADEGLNTEVTSVDVWQDRVWACTHQGLFFKPANGASFTWVSSLGKQRISKVLEDKSGKVWAAASEGLFRLDTATWAAEQLVYQDGVPVTQLESILFDTENNLWIATKDNGLYRLKDGKFINYTYDEGLAFKSIGAVCELDDGSVLAGANNGKLNVIANGKTSIFPGKYTLPNLRIYGLLQSSNGTVWVGTYQGLLKISPNGKSQMLTQNDGLASNLVRKVFEDSKGNIWVATRNNGTTRIAPDGSMAQLNTKNGLSSDFIMSIREDREGNILIGTNNSGLDLIREDFSIVNTAKEQGLPSNLVFNTYTDAENVTWVATNAGLGRIKDGTVTGFGLKEGLENENLFDVLEDGQGNLWLPWQGGLAVVPKADFHSIAEGQRETVSPTNYSKGDGMKSGQFQGGGHAIKSRAGLLYFPMLGGVLAVDPENISGNTLPPPVKIHALVVDDQQQQVGSTLNFKNSIRRCIIRFGTLSLASPQGISFRYRLEPFDQDWQDTKSREAVYTSLSPGNYTFKVTASNSDGAWNEEPAVVQFTVLPYFHELAWVRTAAFFVFFSMAFGVYRWRVYRIRALKAELEEKVRLSTLEVMAKNRLLEDQKREIEARNHEIFLQKAHLEDQNFNLTASLKYASQIQQSMLPQIKDLKAAFSDVFVFFRPKDIVSGDFFWFTQYQDPQSGINRVYIAAVDCTGHGIPGALLSMIGIDLLNGIVHLMGITEPCKILDTLNDSIKKVLKQADTENRDGMEMGLCAIDAAKNEIEFVGAWHHLLMVENGKGRLVKGDKMSVGGRIIREGPFTSKKSKVLPGTVFYLYSDGFQDQFGGIKNKKYGSLRFRDLLVSISEAPCSLQEKLLADELFNWMSQGDENSQQQVDDIMVIGFRV